MATPDRTKTTTQPAEHLHGTMDVTAHERTFHGFVRLAAWNALAIAVVLIFLALANA